MISPLDQCLVPIGCGIGIPANCAASCNVTKGAVSQWRENGIPEARLMYLKLLRPDVFGAETEQKAA